MDWMIEYYAIKRVRLLPPYGSIVDYIVLLKFLYLKRISYILFK